MIYIERKISINNNAATIEEPIILYKGDKNVEVNFIIENSPYKHRAGIETTYGQLVIKRPNSAPIFSDVAKVSNGKVLFIVSGDMIDELEELGSYDFQIRLINADMTSRATLPPVTGGIVIKEPICEETTLNRSRINDRSYVVTSNAPEDVFNESGAYNMLNWQNGDIITDAKMNHIDTAIYEINDVKIDMTALYDYATKEELNTATSDLWASTYEEFQSKADLNHAHEEYITEHQDISHLVTQDSYNDDMYGLSLRVEEIERADYVTEGYVDEAISKIEIPEPDLSNYATEQYVQNKIDEAQLSGGEVDLSDYATKDELLPIRVIGNGIDEYIFTGDEFTDEEYTNCAGKSVLLDNVTINSVDAENGKQRTTTYKNELVYVSFGGSFDGHKSFTIVSSQNVRWIEISQYEIGKDGTITRILYIEYATKDYVKNYISDYTDDALGEYATKSYVDKAVANIEGGGTGSGLNIMTIGDGEKVYKFTGNEFTKEEYGLQWEGDVFFNKVRVGDWTYNEIVQIHCLLEMGTLIDDQYIEGSEFIIYTKEGFRYYIIDKDGVIHFIKSKSGYYITKSNASSYGIVTRDNLSDYGIITEEILSESGYATKDELQAALGNIEDLLGGI